MYIYIYREREREGERDTHTHTYYKSCTRIFPDTQKPRAVCGISQVSSEPIAHSSRLRWGGRRAPNQG